MPRTNRHIEPDTIYHITARGVERRLIFLSSEDKQYFLSTTLAALRAAGCSLLAHCLMGNHFHYLVATGNLGLSSPMHSILTRYAVRFNAQNERDGHLFQARYFARPCLDLRYLHRVIAYIHFNPVRAGLAKHPADWSWSSHGDWMTLKGSTVDFARLHELTDVSPEDFSDSYKECVTKIASKKPRGESIEELIREACAMAGVSAMDLLAGNKGNAYTFAKRMLIDAAQIEGISLYRLAREINCTEAALSLIRKRNT